MDIDIKNKLVLVSGATGFIGSNLIKLLLAEGARVRALVRNPSKAKSIQNKNVEIRTVDFTNPETLKSTVQGCQIVIHLAGVLNEFKPYSHYYQVNVKGTQVLAEAALAAGVERFIHASTVWVYGMDGVGEIDEKSPRIRSGHFYADSKAEGEEIIHHLIKEKNLPAVIVLPSQAYGPDDPSWTMRPLELIRTGRMILINGGKGLIQPIYIDDLVEGIMLAIKKGENGHSYILTGASAISLREYFALLALLAGKKKLPSVPEWLAMGMARTAEFLARIFYRDPIFTRQEVWATLMRASYSGKKAREELGFYPGTDLEAGMNKIKEWIKSTGF